MTGLPSSRSKYTATMDSHRLSGPSRNARQHSRATSTSLSRAERAASAP